MKGMAADFSGEWGAMGMQSENEKTLYECMVDFES